MKTEWLAKFEQVNEIDKVMSEKLAATYGGIFEFKRKHMQWHLVWHHPDPNDVNAFVRGWVSGFKPQK
jgi:hypothetical protein